MKLCSKCKKTKEFELFYRRARSKDGFQAYCKVCSKDAGNIWDSLHKKPRKRQKHQYYQQNKEDLLKKQASYRLKNKDKIAKYFRKRRSSDIEFRLRQNLRNRLNRALHNKQKTGSAIKDLGCSVIFLRKYLESQFEKGMTWENWGLNGWHIDHVLPLSSFDLKDRIQFKKACNYKNLRPMWARENISKGCKVG